jgi:hypothetical protein
MCVLAGMSLSHPCRELGSNDPLLQAQTHISFPLPHMFGTDLPSLFSSLTQSSSSPKAPSLWAFFIECLLSYRSLSLASFSSITLVGSLNKASSPRLQQESYGLNPSQFTRTDPGNQLKTGSQFLVIYNCRNYLPLYHPCTT